LKKKESSNERHWFLADELGFFPPIPWLQVALFYGRNNNSLRTIATAQNLPQLKKQYGSEYGAKRLISHFKHIVVSETPDAETLEFAREMGVESFA